MRLYNSLTRRVENFEPHGKSTDIYVCGITPYDTTHLGHCFTYATFDVLIRFLEFSGQKVRYAQNVTDIDDDILRKAAEVNEDWAALGNRWTNHFIEDNIILNIRPPEYFPRATDVISEIILAVQDLIRAGVAYESGGNIYYHIASDPEYGKLSRLPYDEMLLTANERGNKPDDPNKRDPLDFVLWQRKQAGEPAWDSPWGPGRPGWHIECSTMAGKYLSYPVDIHGGGADLIFPHHESEIAQAEHSTEMKPFSRFWMHVAMLRYQGEKMSKSLGNLVMVRDLLQEGWSPDAIRLCMVSHHYREDWNYQLEGLEKAAEFARKFKETVLLEGGSGQPLDTTQENAAFIEAMKHDLNTPMALASLINLASNIASAAAQGRAVGEAQARLRLLCAMLGLRLDEPDPEMYVIDGWKQYQRKFTK